MPLASEKRCSEAARSSLKVFRTCWTPDEKPVCGNCLLNFTIASPNTSFHHCLRDRFLQLCYQSMLPRSQVILCIFHLREKSQLCMSCCWVLDTARGSWPAAETRIAPANPSRGSTLGLTRKMKHFRKLIASNVRFRVKVSGMGWGTGFERRGVSHFGVWTV